MRKKELTIGGRVIYYSANSDFDLILQYLALKGVALSDAVRECLLIRYLPMTILESDSYYSEVVVDSATSISYWAKSIREYAELNSNKKADLEYEKTMPSLNQREVNSLSEEDKYFGSLLNYFEGHPVKRFDTCAVEVLSMRYLPMTLGKEHDRFIQVAIESANACEAAAKIIRELAGYTVVQPAVAQTPSILLSTPSAIASEQNNFEQAPPVEEDQFVEAQSEEAQSEEAEHETTLEELVANCRVSIFDGSDDDDHFTY